MQFATPSVCRSSSSVIGRVAVLGGLAGTVVAPSGVVVSMLLAQVPLKQTLRGPCPRDP